MKKNIFKVALVAVFALIAGWNVYNSQKEDAMSDIALADVEALAATEIRCTSVVGTLFYCVPNMMLACYCDGARPGRGYERTTRP